MPKLKLVGIWQLKTWQKESKKKVERVKKRGQYTEKKMEF